MSELLLDLNTDLSQKRSGYRLHRLEVLNWGTFHKRIWTMTPDGQNALLTGDIGSGKSTLVDALTTLLVPHQRITYNKAAGADSRERNLRTYIRGAYKNEKVDFSSKARDVFLRSGNQHHTVLLAVFANEGYGHTATLAQVFWMQNESVRKFFVFAENEMSLKEDFGDFGQEMKNLKKRLRKREQTSVFDTFTDYAARFRQTFGIQRPEALDLFYQTVSMKSVGNLTDFVREQMLGQTDIQGRIDELVNRYKELTQAHQAVQRAREQLELLRPMMEEDRRLADNHRKIDLLEEALEELPAYFARLRVSALQRAMEEDYRRWLENEEALEAIQLRLEQQRRDHAGLEARLAGLDLSRQLERIRLELEQLGKEQERRQRAAGQYQRLCEQLQTHWNEKAEGAPPGLPREAVHFLDQRKRAELVLEQVHGRMEQVREELQPLHVRMSRLQDQVSELGEELASLRKRPTQIPQRNLKLRERLLQALKLTAAELPFAGELLQVREEEKDWEGAIERQLRGLGLSLLVPDRHYGVVSAYVDRNHLGGKLVYLRTLAHRRKSQEKPAANSLVHKVRIKQDTEFYDWLEKELSIRYDYICCDNLEEFRRAARGLTRSGQSKAGRISHIKDDRFEVGDRRHYVLGWSNQEKIKTLEQILDKEEQALRTAETELRALRSEEEILQKRRDDLRELLQFQGFEDLNVSPVVLRIQELREEQQRLEAESEELRDLQARIQKAAQEVRAGEKRQYALSEKRGALRNNLMRYAQGIWELVDPLGEAPSLTPPELDKEGELSVKELHHSFSTLDLSDKPPSDVLRERLPEMPEHPSEKQLQRLEKQVRETIGGRNGELPSCRAEVSKLERSISLRMKEFKSRYPEETLDLDADPASLPEFRDKHRQLQEDDIPRHEQRFRELLRQGTIRGILSFKSKLEQYEQDITEKIGRINEHLQEIDYDSRQGTYICIVQEEVRSEDILTFKKDLKACLSDVYGDTEDIYTEEKFFQVKKLLDRFRGETEEDSRWTRRVTDVRQWYTFGADERFRENGESREYYSDSSGKSGGQKEKLAYTILASAIAFQFGLEWGRSRDRSFRFVVIDEAFGRGSDDSTRYGLELFDRLNLQLLIVTPLQKINIIEDYIEAVHYVSNPEGQSSLVRNISKEEYLREKAERFANDKASS